MALNLGPASRECSPRPSAVKDNPTAQGPPSPSSPSLKEGLGSAETIPQQHVHPLNTSARRTVQFHEDVLPPCSPAASGARRLISFPSRGSSTAEGPEVLANLRSTSFASWKADSAQTGACTDSPPVPSLGERLSVAWLWTCTLARATAKLVAYAPLRTLLIPFFALAIFLVAGELGVWAAANSYRSQRETAAASTANSIALQLDFLLQSYITPAIAVGELVTRQPYVPDLMQDANVWMESIIRELDPENTTTQVAVFPWNIKGATFPMTASLATGKAGYVGADYNLNSARNQTVVWAAEHWTQANGYMDLLGPLPPSPENCAYPGFCAREVLWLPTSNPNETWGNEVAFTTPWAVGPNGPIVMGNVTVNPKYRKDACGSNCSAYDNKPLPDGRQLVYWGFVLHCVCMSSLTAILDPLMQSTQGQIQYNFVLYRDNAESSADPGLLLPVNRTFDSAGNLIVYMSQDTTPSEAETANECRAVGALTSMQVFWVICVAPVGGYEAPWAVGLMVAVAIVSLIVASVVFMLMLSMENHRLLVKAMLPPQVVRCLRLGRTYAEPFQDVTILFSDIVSYTNLSSELTPDALVIMLDRLYSGFDDLVDKHQLYKVETIGDAFMCVGGAPKSCHPQDAAIRVARMALDMLAFADGFETNCKRKIQIRVGIYTGPVTAAVMGRKMPHWCLVGDTVNVSSRMESNSKAMQVHVGSTTAALLSSCPEFALDPRGVIDIKGKGPMSTFWLRATGAPCLYTDDSIAAGTPSRLKETVSKTSSE